jgi:hypothetical protein
MIGDMLGDGTVHLGLCVRVLSFLQSCELMLLERPPDLLGHDPEPHPDRSGELGGSDCDSLVHMEQIENKLRAQQPIFA